MTWDFVRHHFDEISKKTGGGLGGVGLFMGVASSFCDAQKREQVQKFFQEHPFPGTERSQKEALESIGNCVTLRDQQQAKLAAWLQQNVTVNAVNSDGTAGSSSGMKH